MTRRVTTYVLVAVAASLAATVAAAWLYVLIVLGERPDVTGTIFLGLQLGWRGLVLAVPAALVFSLVRQRFSRTAFVIAVAATAAALGALLGWWSASISPHISARIASALLASTWAIAACSVSLVTGRSPN